MSGYIRLMRPLVCLSAGGAAFAGLCALGFPFDRPGVAAGTVASVFLLMGAADAFNDYFDLEIDRVNTPHRPIPSGAVSPRGAMAFALALFAAGNAAAWAVSATLGLSAAALSILYAVYGVWSKKLGFVKNLLIGTTGSGSLFLAGAALHACNAVFLAAGLHAFFMMLAVEVSKDVEDMEGDGACGARTWALSVGAERATRAAGALTVAGLGVALAAGLTGASGGALWPSLAAASAASLAPFLTKVPVRTPLMVLSSSALVIAGLVVGSL